MQSRSTLPIFLTALLGLTCATARAQLPANFPAITVSTYNSNKVSSGYLFLASWSQAPGTGTYLLILNNDGTPVNGDKYRELAKMAGDFKVQADGRLSYAQTLAPLPTGGGWDVEHQFVDETLTNVLETVQMRNGYLAEFHDFQVLPNGHALVGGYYYSEVDLSQFAAGGNPAALVSGCVIQELDAQRNAIFQWRSWDHYDFQDVVYPNPAAAVISQFHLNDLNLDADGNLIAGTPSEVRKINRQTGAVMWTLGGVNNEFTSDFGGHGMHRLPNGNFLVYDNSHGTVTSRALEFTLDEVNKTATVVWMYTPETMIAGRFTGYAQRQPNGNTLICWGIPRTTTVPVCTEVTPAGEKVFELFFNDPSLASYRAYRFPFPAADQKITSLQTELVAGNSYDFTNTGVALNVTSGAGGYNDVTVTREPYAPVQPAFISPKSPLVLPVRVSLTAHGISSIGAEIAFDAEAFGFTHPEDLTVYFRANPGNGVFVALPTAPYNPVTKKVRATLSQFGEFILGYPDVADVAYPPILARPESFRGVQTNAIVAPQKVGSGVVYAVNQELPISLAWSPQGFARYYELQIAADASFASPLVNLTYRTEAGYVWSNALPNQTYYWRVRSMIADFTTGDWATNSFRTVAPMIQVATPNGGEAWQPGLKYFIHWNENFGGDIALDLYQGGAFLQTLTTNATTHSYQWEVPINLPPGTDYAIRARSATNAALFDLSDAPFNIAVPTLTSLKQNTAGGWVLTWSGTTAPVYVEFNPALAATGWQVLAGPITGSSWTNSAPTTGTGFYRLRLP